MKLEGSCHCQAVRFSLESKTPYPFMVCYCSICRKTGGGGGYAINIMGLAATLRVEGMEHTGTYRALTEAGEESLNHRHFCASCASALWISNPSYAQWVYPFASAIDTPLPSPPRRERIMENYRPQWTRSGDESGDGHFPEYPPMGIEDWHRQNGLLEAD
ncbi:MAG: GFA family protein [SAR324 cluster bacterium]|nr:GFA family protein [SAR324 cluster bacterium]